MHFAVMEKGNESIDSGLGKFTESQRHMLELQHKMYSVKQRKIRGK